jgi:hypothetical protein
VAGSAGAGAGSARVRAVAYMRSGHPPRR